MATLGKDRPHPASSSTRAAGPGLLSAPRAAGSGPETKLFPNSASESLPGDPCRYSKVGVFQCENTLIIYLIILSCSGAVTEEYELSRSALFKT